jgi:hypothetical protein
MDVVQARREAGPEPARQFDFWLGEWDLTWGDGEHGTNSIYLDFDGRVIVESFDGRPSTGLQGMSISTAPTSPSRASTRTGSWTCARSARSTAGRP